MHSTFNCNLAASTIPLLHAWEHTVGSGRALLGLRADWREHLRRAHFELGFRHVRFHGMLDDDMGTLICQNEKHLYSFFNIDSIFDYLLSICMQPFCELSFMPTTLASGNTTVFRYGGNVTPPKDQAQWAVLIDSWFATGLTAMARKRSASGASKSGTSPTWRPSGPVAGTATTRCTARPRRRSRRSTYRDSG